MSIRSILALLSGLALSACGASTVEQQEPAPAVADLAEEAGEPGVEEAPGALAEPEPEPEPEPVEEPPPEPEPVDVIAGRSLGPIRVGMSEEEVRALGLEEQEGDWQSRIFGPYRVFFARGAVRRIEARIGDLGRIRVGEHVFAAGTHIHALRDAFGECRWQEGGGERYRCAGGTLFIRTAHSMDPARYTIAVENRD